MAEDKKQENIASNDKAAAAVAQSVYGDRDKGQRSGGGRPFKRDSRSRDQKRDEFEQKVIEISRVTRVMGGGKRMNFRACVAIGDRKHGVAVALGKGADVSIAINKAVNKAKKNIIKVPVVNDTIPHTVRHKLGAAIIVFKPANQGKGVMAGGAVRAILELAGIKNVSAKILGTNNKVNNARCTIAALSSLREVPKKVKSDKLGKSELVVAKEKELETEEVVEKTKDNSKK